MSDALRRVRLALVDDYEVVVAGLAHMFDCHSDRIEIVQLAPDTPVTEDVDIALYDTFAQGEADSDDLDVLLENPHAKRVVVYTWVFDDDLIETALSKGVSGYLSKTMPADELVDALERIDAGDVVVADSPTLRSDTLRRTTEDGGRPGHHGNGNGNGNGTYDTKDWPGREHGLSERESEIVALISQGKNNAEIAALTFLSINSVKTYIRSSYAKMDVTSRTQAVLWAISHGFEHGGRRIELWRLD